MPILESNFIPSLPFKNGHFNTIYRNVFVKTPISYDRKRITTWDNDFIDLDFSNTGSKNLALLIHGLEGSSKSNYMISTAKKLNSKGFDTAAMNLRGCSGEDNLLLKTYHSGKTDDLDFILSYLTKNYDYENIVIIGFSLGGNITLKYLGEYQNKIHSIVRGAVAISVPVDLTSSQAELSKFKNKLYMNEFLKTMKLKLLEKSEKFPDFHLDKKKLFKASKFKHIEALFTVPVFGFKNSEDYWQKASSKPYISKIKLPTLLINALDDSFLAPECFPFKEARTMKNFFLSTPKYGGHVGFLQSFTHSENTWLEDSIYNFIATTILQVKHKD